MPDFGITAGDTDKTIYIRLRDSTTGLGKTGLVYSSLGATCSYTLPFAARVAITLATQTVIGAHSDGGFVEIDATNCKGLYRLDLPDAAIASGDYTIVSIEFDGIIVESIYISLAEKPDFGITVGDTDKAIYVRLRDSTTGLGKTGLVYNSAGATCSYTLPLAARAAITLATQTVTGIHSDGGFVEVDATNCKGLYRLDLPDAAIASGDHAIISIEFDGVIEESINVSFIATVVQNADDLAIANRALLLMGESTITSFEDTDKRSTTVNELFVPARDSVIESHLWKTCRSLAVLVQDTTYTATNATWVGDVATITFASHSIEVGDSVTVSDFVPTGYNGDYTVVTADATTITYALTTDPGASPATTFGTVLDPIVPAWKYGKQFAMPSDFVRLVRIENEDQDYEIHQDKMVTDQATVKVEYVFRQTDVSMMNPIFKEAIALKLAMEMSYRLDTSTSKREELTVLYLEILRTARNIDASQRPDDIIQSSEWLKGRLGTNSLFRGIS